VAHPQKPRDVGNGIVCASFGRNGEWLSLGTVDPKKGFIELTGLPLFDPELRGNIEAVLRYRSWMRREEHAFLHLDAGRATVTTREDAQKGARSVVQRVVISAERRFRPTGIRLRFSGRLGRPTLAQFGEAAGVVAAPASLGTVKPRSGTLVVRGEGPPVIVQAWLRHGGESSEGSTEGRTDLRLAWQTLPRRMPSAEAWLDWPADADEVHLDLACTFDQTVPEAPDWLTGPSTPEPAEDASPPRTPGTSTERKDRAASTAAVVEQRPLRVPARLVKPIGAIDQRAATYVRTCTALRAGPAERVMLADHRVLPHSRTRDAYWQARLLLASAARGGPHDDQATVADHLRWLFLRCHRPDGRWARAHDANGARLDDDFPADQQLYPLLELADHLAAAGRLPDLPPDRSWPDLVASVWAGVTSMVDPATGLLGTDQDAADERPAHPFLVTDQVLLWHTATRLAAVAGQLGLERAELLAMAERVRRSVDEHFVSEGPLGQQWAHCVDGKGGRELYGDARDLPLALAPLWGFCAPDLPAWRTTLVFAFHASNPGVTEGAVAGLGSRQLPGTYTLGDIMGWVALSLMGERRAADIALERLIAASFDDGMLPEAYDPQGTGSVVRHWFAWPGAALASLVLEHAARDGG
jgi:hypothetical protein